VKVQPLEEKNTKTRSTHAPFLGQSATMIDNTDIELKKENTFKNNE